MELIFSFYSALQGYSGPLRLCCYSLENTIWNTFFAYLFFILLNSSESKVLFLLISFFHTESVLCNKTHPSYWSICLWNKLADIIFSQSASGESKEVLEHCRFWKFWCTLDRDNIEMIILSDSNMFWNTHLGWNEQVRAYKQLTWLWDTNLL